jgi:hypothetical protein
MTDNCDKEDKAREAHQQVDEEAIGAVDVSAAGLEDMAFVYLIQSFVRMKYVDL